MIVSDHGTEFTSNAMLGWASAHPIRGGVRVLCLGGRQPGRKNNITSGLRRSRGRRERSPRVSHMKPSGPDHGIPLVVATKQSSQRDRRVAIIAVAVLFAGTMLWAPFASVQLSPIGAFSPVLQSLMCVADLITATLLLSQYAVQAQPAILIRKRLHRCRAVRISSDAHIPWVLRAKRALWRRN